MNSNSSGCVVANQIDTCQKKVSVPRSARGLNRSRLVLSASLRPNFAVLRSAASRSKLSSDDDDA